MVDPRFLSQCPNHPTSTALPAPAPDPTPKPIPDPTRVSLPLLPSSLFSIEKIIESELKSLESVASGSVESVATSSKQSGTHVSDQDEGFYDKPSISPTNSID